jgi:hypothetical protein
MFLNLLAIFTTAAVYSSQIFAHGITAKRHNAKDPTFDIVHAQISQEKGSLVFKMKVAGKAGQTKPTKSGALGGSSVFSYVWPTSLNSSEVGFDKDQGILALAVTAHPDFDDTPKQDENGDGKNDNDGDVWHSHWVVLVKDETCGSGSLKVKDIPEGTKPKLPETWPGLPILIDSPGYTPSLKGNFVSVRVPMPKMAARSVVNFDAVTAGLRVSDSVHTPLLCVKDVFDVASGDLSLPGKTMIK